MSSSKGQAAAAATMAKVTQPVTESNKKNGAAVVAPTKKPAAAAAAGKIEVPKYKRSDGTLVSEHVRRPPGQAEAEAKEQSKREREEKKAAKAKAFFESKGKKKEKVDEGDWEEQDDENELGDGGEEEEDEESKRARTEQEEQEGQEEGEQQQQHENGGGADEGALVPQPQSAPLAQKPKMSMNEFLSMPWAHQQAVLIDKKLEQSKDSISHTLVVKDAINAAVKNGSTAFSDAAMGLEDDDVELGYSDFLAAFDKAGHHNSGDRASVSRHLRSGKYHDAGEWGKTCLVPHLYGAGMNELAKAVQSGKYRF